MGNQMRTRTFREPIIVEETTLAIRQNQASWIKMVLDRSFCKKN